MDSVQRKVLVVDDSEILRMTYQLLLELQVGQAIQVVTAASGAEALARLQIQPDIALIVTDLDMPDMSGWELLGRCRRDPRLRSIPVLLTSGALSAGDLRRAREAGATRCLATPCSLTELRRAVATALAPAA